VQAIKNIFHEADKDKNGTLDRKELGIFLKAVLASSTPLTKEDIDEAFKLADKDGNGKVDANEFIDLFDAQVLSARPSFRSSVLILP